jgi:hypothetical protein
MTHPTGAKPVESDAEFLARMRDSSLLLNNVRPADSSRLLSIAESAGKAIEALESFACECTGRCENMEWLPAGTRLCAFHRARAALNQPKETSDD